MDIDTSRLHDRPPNGGSANARRSGTAHGPFSPVDTEQVEQLREGSSSNSKNASTLRSPSTSMSWA